MRQLWLTIFSIMLVGAIIKSAIFSQLLWIAVDIAILIIVYILLRRNPLVDFQKSMIFLGTLTGVSILVDLGIVDGVVGSLVSLGLVAWVMFGGGKKKSSVHPKIRHKWHK